LYVNGGELLSQVYDFAPPATDHRLTLGGADASYFRGKIDDVRIYDLPLGAEDIQSIITEAK
jgi:hypothetical protein